MTTKDGTHKTHLSEMYVSIQLWTVSYHPKPQWATNLYEPVGYMLAQVEFKKYFWGNKQIKLQKSL